MRAVIQRVSEASVSIAGDIHGKIGLGFVVLVGISRNDSEEDARQLSKKILGLRVFQDEAGKMNLDLSAVGGSLLLISQFTLYGDVKKGMRPSFDRAAPPEQAQRLYDYFVAEMRRSGLVVETGVFQADMRLSLVNQGPVTILYDSERTF